MGSGLAGFSPLRALWYDAEVHRALVVPVAISLSLWAREATADAPRQCVRDGQTKVVEPPPRGCKVVHRRQPKLIIAGALTFTTAYVVAFTLAIRHSDARAAFFPVAGPFVAMGTHVQRDARTGATIRAGSDAVLFMLSGLTQTAGALVLGFGVAGEKSYVRDPFARPGAPAADDPMRPAPYWPGIAVGPGTLAAAWSF